MTLPLTSQLCSGDLAVHVTIPEGFSPVPQSPTAAPLRELCLKALQAPVGFPELWQCVIPGDNVAVAIDPEIPDIAGILSLIHEELQRVPEGGVSLTLVLPADPAGRQWQWLRELLPLHLQQSITFVDHDVADRTHVSYIASSLSGERIYLNRHVAEADLIITIGITRFDPALGYRGTSSCLFPALTDTETQIRNGFTPSAFENAGELESRRQLVDEVGSLAGTQFTLQLIHGTHGPMEVLAGHPDQVFERARTRNQQYWTVSLNEPADAVLTSVPGGPTAWSCFGQALENVMELIDQGGRIIVVADLDMPEGPAATLVRRTQDPEELLRPLKKEPLPDGTPFLQLIEACRRARVYLLSRLPAEVVEELGMIPLAGEAELQKLLTTVPQCVVLPNAHCARCLLK